MKETREIRYEIELTEDVYGMYNFKHEKGVRVSFDRETEGAYFLIAGCGEENIIPKSKAIKIKITKICHEIEEIEQ